MKSASREAVGNLRQEVFFSQRQHLERDHSWKPGASELTAFQSSRGELILLTPERNSMSTGSLRKNSAISLLY